MPLFGAECADELFVMGDHYDAALEVADCNGQAAEGVPVEEVGGFVEDENVPDGTLVIISNGIRELVTYGLFHIAPASTTFTFCPPLRPEI